ncbi:MAG: hypothetical protein WB760_05455 [Xanthobacteraceae bacterium]
MSVQEGFESGCGCVFGVIAAVVILIVSLTFVGSVVTICPACFSSGKCTLCGGSGKGILWGDCMNCGGRKSCPECRGRGWKWKK